MSVNFGLHIESPTVVSSYLNGSLVDRYNHAAQSGSYIGMAVANDDGGNCQPHIDRLEVRDAPGGSLLLADDFASLASWTAGWTVSGGAWSINPAGFAYQAGEGATIYRADVADGAYIEAQGVTFDASVTDGWLMLMLEMDTPAANPTLGALDGYRVLLRAPGAPNAGGVEIVNGLPLSGWSVGMVRIA